MPRTIVISDTHIPRDGKLRSARELEPLIGDCDRLVVNGDLAETHKQTMRRTVETELGVLRDLVGRAGTELLLLCGNHDPEISQWRAAEFGAGRVLVTHGDAFDPRIAPWAREAAVMQAEWERIQALHPGEETIVTRFDSVRGAAIAEWWMDPSRPGYTSLLSFVLRPGAVRRVLEQWREFPTNARAFAARFFPDAEWVLVGHCHRNGIDRRASPTVVNTGAFGFPTRPLGVILEDDRLEIRRLRRTDRGWAVDPNGLRLEAEVPGADRLHELHGPPLELPTGNKIIPRAWVEDLPTGPGTTSPRPVSE